MPEESPPLTPAKEQALRAEIGRLNKVNRALMDRAERSTTIQGSDYGMFQTTIMLEELVRQRTEELQTALRENERITSALRESEARFRGLVNQSLAGIAIIEDGRFTYANSRLSEMYGYSAEEMMRLGPVETTARVDRDLVQAQMRRRLSGEIDHLSYVFRALRKNGVMIEVECHSSVMDVSGQPILINLMIDITERARAEREIRALQDQLREQAIRDPLTGLYNRIPLNEFFDRELSLAERRRKPVSAVMVDVDHFKTVNDSFGHLAGDKTLKDLSNLIRGSFRTSDICCRYGGEEFLIVLPDSTSDDACQRAEGMRKKLENTEIEYDSARFHVTATFGVAMYPEHACTREALIAAADKALYEGKESGRNRVVCYGAQASEMR
jgi:diguanylate cyclase (GGDEF)-like protein/PAS domain S-box-containing protein